MDGPCPAADRGARGAGAALDANGHPGDRFRPTSYAARAVSGRRRGERLTASSRRGTCLPDGGGRNSPRARRRTGAAQPVRAPRRLDGEHPSPRQSRCPACNPHPTSSSPNARPVRLLGRLCDSAAEAGAGTRTVVTSPGRTRLDLGGCASRSATPSSFRRTAASPLALAGKRIPAHNASALLLARRRANAVRRFAPAFVSPQAFRAATLAASGYGGERQSRRECRLGDKAALMPLGRSPAPPAVQLVH